MAETKPTPNVSKQVLSKLDDFIDNFNEFKVEITRDISELKTKVDMQPKIDQQSFDNISNKELSCQVSNNQRFNKTELEIKELKDNQTWLVRTVIGQLIITIGGIILAVINKL